MKSPQVCCTASGQLALSLQVLRSVAAERRVAEEQAIHDGLTGLPNRAQVLSHLERLLLRANATACSVLLIDHGYVPGQAAGPGPFLLLEITETVLVDDINVTM